MEEEQPDAPAPFVYPRLKKYVFNVGCYGALLLFGVGLLLGQVRFVSWAIPIGFLSFAFAMHKVVCPHCQRPIKVVGAGTPHCSQCGHKLFQT